MSKRLTVTAKTWSEFLQYRDKKFREVLKSDDYKEVQKLREKNFERIKSKVVKRKFLFWEWEKKVYPSIYSYTDFFSFDNRLDTYEDLLMAKVPDKTIEACLDWMAGEEEK